MTKEQLTPEKISHIEGLSYQIKATEEDAQLISAPLPESALSGDDFRYGPIQQYGHLISRHGIGDLYETFRLLLFARLQKRGQELKAKLLEQINEKG